MVIHVCSKKFGRFGLQGHSKLQYGLSCQTRVKNLTTSRVPPSSCTKRHIFSLYLLPSSINRWYPFLGLADKSFLRGLDGKLVRVSPSYANRTNGFPKIIRLHLFQFQIMIHQSHGFHSSLIRISTHGIN